MKYIVKYNNQQTTWKHEADHKKLGPDLNRAYVIQRFFFFLQVYIKERKTLSLKKKRLEKQPKFILSYYLHKQKKGNKIVKTKQWQKQSYTAKIIQRISCQHILGFIGTSIYFLF